MERVVWRFSNAVKKFGQPGPLLRKELPHSLAVRSMSTVDDKFVDAQSKLKDSKADADNNTKLKLYALYKQATVGPNTSDKPRILDIVKRSMWDSWSSLGDMSKEAAKEQYVVLVGQLTSTDEQPTMTREKYSDIKITVDGGLKVIKLNRPNKCNAITNQMYLDVTEILNETAKDEKNVITVLTGAGDYYCSGNDISNSTKVDLSNVAKDVKATRMRLKNFINAFINFPRVLIAVVNGPAIGIAVTTLALCDAVYATDRATFQTPFTSLGLSAEGCSSYLFPRIMGQGKASELLYFNRKITAQEAREWGLVTEVFPDTSFHQEIWPRLKHLGTLPPQSMMYSKQLTRREILKALHETNDAECERLVERWQSKECNNAIVNFLSRKNKK